MALTRWVHLFRDGLNKPRDSRKAFIVDAEAAAETIKHFKEHGGPMPMDYLHASVDKSVPAPFPDRFMKSGDMLDAEWRPGKGLYFLTKFTDRGSEFIAKREMNSASAEAFINPKTNKLYKISGATLCNRAALALDPITLSESDTEKTKNEAIELEATNPEANHNHAATNAAGATNMSYLSQIAVLLGASEDESPEALAEKGVGKLSALMTARDSIAAAVGLDGKTNSLEEIGAAVQKQLLAVKPDMSGFIALADHTAKLTEADTKFTALSEQFAAAEATVKLAAAEDAVRAANSDGKVRITPAMKPFAIKLFQRSPEDFKEYADQLPVQLSTTEIVDPAKVPDEVKPSQGNLIALAASKLDPTIQLVESPKGKE